MANHSLGFVTVPAAGTPVRTTANLPVPTANCPAHSYLIEALPANTGDIYVGRSTMNTVTGADVFVVIPASTANVYPSFTSTIIEAAAGFNMAEIWLDAEVNGDGALVSIIRA